MSLRRVPLGAVRAEPVVDPPALDGATLPDLDPSIHLRAMHGSLSVPESPRISSDANAAGQSPPNRAIAALLSCVKTLTGSWSGNGMIQLENRGERRLKPTLAGFAVPKPAKDRHLATCRSARSWKAPSALSSSSKLPSWTIRPFCIT